MVEGDNVLKLVFRNWTCKRDIKIDQNDTVNNEKYYEINFHFMQLELFKITLKKEWTYLDN